MSETTKRGSPRKKIVLPTVLGVALVVGAFYGIPKIRYAMNHESTDDAFVEGTVATISFRTAGHVRAVHVGDNERVAAGALIAELDPAPYEVQVRDARAALEAAKAKLAGFEASLTLTEETTVAAVSGASAGVDVAAAELAAARTNVDVVEGNLEDARVEVKVSAAATEEAEAAVAAAKASADLDATDLERARNLYAEKTTTKADLDHAEAAARVSRAKLEQAEKAAVVARARQEQATTRVKVAESTLAQAKVGVDRSQAALEAARARLKSARSEARQVDVAKSERDRQRAEVARAEADLERAQLDLGYTKLVAPVAGRITKKSLTVGQWVQAGQAVLALVPDEVWVVGNYKETQVGHIRPGLPVRIEVDAFPDHVFTGRVDSVQAGTGSRFSLLPAENATGNYVKVVQRIPVKIVFDPLPDLSRFPLSPGMSVVPDVKIEAE